jgi:CRISPR-associated exonuclease Cas4
VEKHPLPISALQHYIFCPRQCALIHIEGLWAENRLTVEGNILHHKAHGEKAGPRGGGRAESRPRVRIVRGLALSSEALGLKGKADVVEFHANPGSCERTNGTDSGEGRVRLASGTPFPIEYKRGRPKRHDADIVQLCAQALCLEEMLKLGEGGVPRGAIFYGQTRKRLDVVIDNVLRQRTLDVIMNCRTMIESGITPRAAREKKCERCSMLNLCLPGVTGPAKSALRYIAAATGSGGLP